MTAPTRGPRVRLETKVMVAVLAVLVVLPVTTLWIVDRHLQEQVQRDADFALAGARTTFPQALKARNDELAVRLRSGFYDQRFLAILGLNDAATMQAFLQEDVLGEYRDTEIVLFVNPDGKVFAKARSGGPATVSSGQIAAGAEALIRAALQGEAATENFLINGHFYDVVALPVSPLARRVAGALVFGIRISDATLQRVQPPGAEILVTARNQVVASTLKDAAQNDAVLRQLAENAASGRDVEVRVAGERFRPATGPLDAASAQQGLRYIVLAAVERRLSDFERTRRTLVGLSALGILLSGGVVWFFVRRITRPLAGRREGARAPGSDREERAPLPQDRPQPAELRAAASARAEAGRPACRHRGGARDHGLRLADEQRDDRARAGPRPPAGDGGRAPVAADLREHHRQRAAGDGGVSARGADHGAHAARGRDGDDRVPGQRPGDQARAPRADLRSVFHHEAGGQGHGLGLSLCYGLIQEHGGKISARSDPGQGAVFMIELPVAQQAAAPALLFARGGSAAPFAAEGNAPSGKTILVIDDEAWILELAAELLRREGHTVETAQGGQQALERLARQRFDVIVSDWKMPGLNGVRLYEHLRATDAAAAKRVLFMTGDTVSDSFQEFLRTNQLTCLSKPFATGEFRAAVARMFRTG